MDGVEPAYWSWKLSWRWLELLGSLHKVTLVAVVDYGLHIPGEPPLNERLAGEFPCSPDSGVVELVQLLHNTLTHGLGGDDPGLAGGHVCVQDQSGRQSSGGTGEGGGADQFLDILARLLGGCELLHGEEGDGV